MALRRTLVAGLLGSIIALAVSAVQWPARAGHAATTRYKDAGYFHRLRAGFAVKAPGERHVSLDLQIVRQSESGAVMLKPTFVIERDEAVFIQFSALL